MAKAKTKAVLDDNQVQLIARALSDPRRYEILKHLGARSSPLACTDVRKCTEISPATLSHHMRELEIAGLVEPQRKGKFVSYHLRREMLNAFYARLRDDFSRG
jgi:ArsR family transcriptional regulator, arsenate/arsenite/antimonite-responsive transcriptional repressor